MKWQCRRCRRTTTRSAYTSIVRRGTVPFPCFNLLLVVVVSQQLVSLVGGFTTHHHHHHPQRTNIGFIKSAAVQSRSNEGPGFHHALNSKTRLYESLLHYDENPGEHAEGSQNESIVQYNPVRGKDNEETGASHLLSDNGNENVRGGSSRRTALLQIMATTTTMTMAPALAARAGVPEIDQKTGEMYSPRTEMMGGRGSSAARGMDLRDRRRDTEQQNIKRSLLGAKGGPIQTVYETRFVVYLSRFLLNLDPAAKSWWTKQESKQATEGDGTVVSKEALAESEQLRFAEFAESVEVGLADYFVGPYGSYASVKAAMAGVSAVAPATSKRMSSSSSPPPSILEQIMGPRSSSSSSSNQSKKTGDSNGTAEARQGVLNLYALLKARYTSIYAKKQLAILFSLISSPYLQPVSAIRGLLGEIDNASITGIELVSRRGKTGPQEVRCSARYGGGYSVSCTPEVKIGPPPALGSDYKPASIQPIMKPTTRILRIQVVDGGNGYVATEPPAISVSLPESDPDWFVIPMEQRESLKSSADEGKVGFVPAFVTTMALGYDNTTVKTSDMSSFCSNFGTADDSVLAQVQNGPLELLPASIRPDFESVENNLKRYRISSLPAVPQKVELPSARYRAKDPLFGYIGTKPVTKGAASLTASEYSRLALSGALCTVLVRTVLNPLELVKTKIQLKNDDELNAFAREKVAKTAKKDSDHIKAKPSLEQKDDVDFKDQTIPKSGAPMKRRIIDGKEGVALLDDKVLQETAAPSSLLSSDPSPQVGEVVAEASIGTLAMASSIVELRGPFALFQSADITFLASLVFGSFGFGATELFRRVFTAFFFDQDANASGGGSELVLLGAAALACILTSAAATPFEMMRVRSMGLVEAKGWKDVLVDFLGEKREARGSSIGDRSDKRQSGNDAFRLSDIEVQDLKPLWGGFGPTLSRELPFAVVKFWAFDVIAKLFLSVINSGTDVIEPVQVGVGAEGLAVSAIAGALAGVAGAIISHPADLILTLTSSSKKKNPPEDGATTANEATGE
eukprot:scaffold29330_cov56-Attheya_sp.AAC.1